MSALDTIRDQRFASLEVFAENGHEKYPHNFEVTHPISEISNFSSTFLDTEKVVSLAGRIVLLRPMGKSCFLTFQDHTGRFQAFLQQNTLGEASMKLSKKLDVGDIIGITGKIFKTQAGELTIRAESYSLLAKSFRPLPEKHHGLQDVELRYRNRHLDLICNEDVRTLFENKSMILYHVRNFLFQCKYVEVETPILQPLYGGAAAQPFKTHHNELDADLYLRIAPELYLKRLLVGGFDRVFEIGRNFRNEGVSTRHNPEFTMLEFYSAYKDYRHGISMTRSLLNHITLMMRDQKINEINPIEVELIDLVDSFIKERMLKFENTQAFGKWDWYYLDIPSFLNALKSSLTKLDLEDCDADDAETIIMNIYEKHIEHTIPCAFVTGFPKSISPLAKARKDNPRVAERFELIVNGVEIANGYSELNDPVEQLKAFEAQDAPAGLTREIDSEYIEALEYGMPPACGVGIGIDRLVMALTGANSIRDVVLFPAMRRLQNVSEKENV